MKHLDSHGIPVMCSFYKPCAKSAKELKDFLHTIPMTMLKLMMNQRRK
jgi:hypothetical protein